MDYILLKDMPSRKAGTIYRINADENYIALSKPSKGEFYTRLQK